MAEEVWDIATLERHLLEAEGNLSAELCQSVLTQGEDIVPALIQVLNREDLQMEDAPGEGWLPIHAADLLGKLKAVTAIPHLVHWLVEAEEWSILKDRLAHTLSEIGEPAFEPLMAAYHQAEEAIDRSYLRDALAEVGHHDEELYQIFLDELKTNLTLGAIHLSVYGDRRAVAALSQALDEWKLSDGSALFADHDVIELAAAIEELGGELSPDQQQKLNRVQENGKRLQERRVLSASPYLQQTLRESGSGKLGRNEPCWCGSGKKYKKCHWDADQRTLD